MDSEGSCERNGERELVMDSERSKLLKLMNLSAFGARLGHLMERLWGLPGGAGKTSGRFCEDAKHGRGSGARHAPLFMNFVIFVSFMSVIIFARGTWEKRRPCKPRK